MVDHCTDRATWLVCWVSVSILVALAFHRAPIIILLPLSTDAASTHLGQAAAAVGVSTGDSVEPAWLQATDSEGLLDTCDRGPLWCDRANRTLLTPDVTLSAYRCAAEVDCSACKPVQGLAALGLCSKMRIQHPLVSCVVQYKQLHIPAAYQFHAARP